MNANQRSQKPTYANFYSSLFSKSYDEINDEYNKQAEKLGLTNNVQDYYVKYREIAKKQNLIVHTPKGALEVPLRIPMSGEYVIIDACNAVVGMETFADISQSYYDDIELSNDEKINKINEIAAYIGAQLSDIFGNDFYNLTYTGKGLHFYKYAFTIGHPDAILGKVAFGGQNGTVLIMISGTGTIYADEFWEHRFYAFLKHHAKRAKLTRIDLAHDDFNGAYSSPELADAADSRGMFALTNKMPTVQHLGDWKRHKGKGRTLQIGMRENGKLFRGYEKGKKFGDKESPWFRSEIEFGNAGRILDFEMLISPTEYFCGAYPYCLEIIEQAHGSEYTNVTRIPCVKKESEISLEKSIDIWKRQAGRYIAAYRQIFTKQTSDGQIVPDDKFILDLLMTEKKDFYPKRLRVIQKFSQNPPSYAPWADIELASA